MTGDACQQYLEDPEAHAAHLDRCDDCRVLFGMLGDGDDLLPERELPSAALRTLPLAPWEGASHRAWPLVLGGAALLVAAAALLFSLAGVSPAAGFRNAVSTNVPSVGSAMTTAQLVGEALQHAPALWQVGLAVAFLAINALFLFLLKRAPRGVDG